MMNDEGFPLIGTNGYDSGFNGVIYENSLKTDGIDLPSPKYYDVYKYATTDQNFSRRILGDATGEIGPFAANSSFPISSWYGDISWFVTTWDTWFIRGFGALYGNLSGIFSFTDGSGYHDPTVSFRVVLTP